MRTLLAILVFVLAGGTPALAQERLGPATSMDELFARVRDRTQQEAEENKAREQKFIAEKELQAQKLQQARQELAAQEARLARLNARYEANLARVQTKKDALKKATGDLGEVFGVLRKISGETAGILDSSLLTVQFSGQPNAAREIAKSKELPSQEQIEALWQSMLWAMIKGGSVETFEGPIIGADGKVKQSSILRVGTFNAFAKGNYLRFLPEGEKVKLVELSRQPSAAVRAQAQALGEAAIDEPLPISLDPSRGSVVELLVQAPSWRERIAQGGVIGYIILLLGALGLIIAIERFVYLAWTGAKIRRQSRQPEQAQSNNPLGRMLEVAQRFRDVDAEALLLRLEEQLAKELPALRRGLGMITLFATTAPLLGLLGTVTGMIETFQSITLFGNGDPKMMSGGISQALVTTKLGLATSIPLMLLHALVSQRASKLAQLLEEAGTSRVAERLAPEREDGEA